MVFAGSVSTTTTPVASWFPVFCTVRVYVSVSLIVALVTVSSLVILMLGVAVRGVSSLEILFIGVGSAPFTPLSAIEIVLAVLIIPLGIGLLIFTLNIALPNDPDGPAIRLVAPALRLPIAKVHTVPATEPFGQDQPAVEPLDTNVEFAGTVSVKTPATEF